MGLAVVHSRGRCGVDAPNVTVEVHLANGLPAFSIVGLPETAVKESRDRVRGALLVLSLVVPALAADAQTPETVPEELVRGRRIFEASGGCTCHTNYPGEGQDAPELAGGRALETPFGVFYSTNITPDVETGIGDWTDADFIRAMREGLSPTGEHYFPVFPYPSFTGLRDADLIAMKAYLDSRPAVAREQTKRKFFCVRVSTGKLFE